MKPEPPSSRYDSGALERPMPHLHRRLTMDKFIGFDSDHDSTNSWCPSMRNGSWLPLISCQIHLTVAPILVTHAAHEVGRDIPNSAGGDASGACQSCPSA